MDIRITFILFLFITSGPFRISLVWHLPVTEQLWQNLGFLITGSLFSREKEGVHGTQIFARSKDFCAAQLKCRDSEAFGRKLLGCTCLLWQPKACASGFWMFKWGVSGADLLPGLMYPARGKENTFKGVKGMSFLILRCVCVTIGVVG